METAEFWNESFLALGPSYRPVLHCRNGSDGKGANHACRSWLLVGGSVPFSEPEGRACFVAVCFQDGLFAESSDGRKGNKSSLVGSSNAGDRDQLRARRALIMRSHRYDNQPDG